MDTLAGAVPDPSVEDHELEIVRLERTSCSPPMTVVSLADRTKLTGIPLIVFPGGGYRKVCVDHEGKAVARYFAEVGMTVFVVDYALAPRPLWGFRAESVEVSLSDAIAALHFVRTADKHRFGPLDPARISLIGFSAGAHLSLCLLKYDADQSSRCSDRDDVTNELKTIEAETRKPPVRTLVLVYPTLRNPCCWCIVGGLWVAPAGIGRGWAADDDTGGQHRYCWGEDDQLQELLASLPQHILAVTSTGDMLLPTEKHAGRLIAAVRAARGSDSAEHWHHSSMLAYHGFGLRAFWAERAREWVVSR